MGYYPLIIRQARVARRRAHRGAAGHAGRVAGTLRRAAGARTPTDARQAGAKQAGARGERQAGARGSWQVGARPCVAWACCWASRLCTRCTQPVLTQFRLSTV